MDFIINSLKAILLTTGLCGQWLVHYMLGEGKEKDLPREAIPLTKKSLIKAFSLHLEGSKDYQSCTARCGLTDTHDWWEGLAGVVGEFRWKPEFVEEGVWFHCWDQFDFNDTASSDLALSMPKSLYNLLIDFGLSKSYIKEMDLEMKSICYFQGQLWIVESVLNRLWRKHKLGTPFLTTWSIFIPNEELPPYHLELLEVGENGEFLCPNYSRIKYREEKEQWWEEEYTSLDTSWWDS